MHLASAYACASVLLSLVDAHGPIPGAPKLFGRSPIGSPSRAAKRGLEDVKLFDRSPVAGPRKHHDKHESDALASAGKRGLEARQNVDGPCGPGVGKCADGYCCSGAGYCGNTPDYCNAPDCQISFGPGCDGNKSPPGSSTADVKRPKVGNVPYGGAGIYDCIANGVVALTYDDGPYIYTSYILDVLKSYNAKATFFITGNNLGKGEIDKDSTGYPALIKRMIAEGHQVASHTWSHQDLSKITADQRKAQMIHNEMAFRNILGYFPTYMRPPYSSCDGACQNAMGDLGYHITYFDVDTDDYDNDSPLLIQNAKNNFNNAVKKGTPASSDYLSIAHDIHEQTAHNLTKYMLETLKQYGYKTVTVGECLNDPKDNWYRKADGAGTSPPSSSTSKPPSKTTSAPASPSTSHPVSDDATCGKQSKVGATCQGSEFGNCCSQYGWCGSDGDYCSKSNGCQDGFGTCK